MSRRKLKLLIPIILLFMVIGFATVSTTLSINTNIEMLSDLSDFSVYYSRALVNGEEDSSIITSSKGLDFNGVLDKVGTTYIVEYDVTNASASFDADITMNCTGSTEYFEISNVFDTSTDLGARQTRTGILTLKKIKTIADNTQNSKVSCELIASPVEITEEGSGEVPTPLDPYYIGREITIGTEKFNVISSDTTTVKMLFQGSIGGELFSDESGWEYSPGPKEIDIWEWSPYISNLVDEYVNYLKTEYDVDVTGDLITLKELGDLGCKVPTDYLWGDVEEDTPTCADSVYSDWLIDNEVMGYWTRSAYPEDSNEIWLVDGWGDLFTDDYDMHYYEVRPVITISKEVLDTIITFTIAGEEYKAYKGMTWREWVDSGFNLDKYFVGDSCVGFRVKTAVSLNDVMVKPEDKIEENVIYSASGSCNVPLNTNPA